MDAFVTRVQERAATGVAPPALTSLQESLESHLLAFAAETARTEGIVVTMSDVDH
jgi:hypothetical protein